ncbi:MAG: hypothetical protein ACFFDF_00475 [Candidatus Odinarchaeota archaeon]
MQDLWNELTGHRQTLNTAIEELKKRGRSKAKAEEEYRIELAKKMLEEREKKTPVTILSDICRGDKKIAKLKFERDFSETMYETCFQKIYSEKLEIGVIERQMQAERKGE